jgi:hypothetical protein
MGNILGALLGVMISGGLFVLYERALAKGRATDPSDDAPWRSKGTRPLHDRARVLAIVSGGAAVLFFGVREYRRIQDRRHPAVDEHRDELVRAAAQALHCGEDKLTVQSQEPTLARVEGCGVSVMLRWGPVLNRTSRLRSKTPFWHEIDPNCRIDAMGCAMPCE